MEGRRYDPKEGGGRISSGMKSRTMQDDSTDGGGRTTQDAKVEQLSRTTQDAYMEVSGRAT